MKEPELKLSKNSKELVTKFNKIASENNFPTIKNEAIYQLEILDPAKKKTKKETKKVEVKITDKFEMLIHTDNSFIGNSASLSAYGSKIFTSIFDELKNLKGEISSITIESSTDSEPKEKHKGDGDDSGNIKLATLRTKVIADLIESINDEILVKHRELPNNGSDVVNSKEFLNAKEDDKLFKKLKDKTLEFRYVKLTVALDVVDKISGEEKPENFVKSYRHSLTKTFDSQKDKNDKLMFENKSLKCGSKGKKKFCKTI